MASEKAAIEFKELQPLIANDEVMLIDVREPEELTTDGKIPKSINIPVKELAASLQMSPEDFLGKYGIVKPKNDATNLVFSCRSGRRAQMAHQTAVDLGFTNARVYAGSFTDWVTNGGTVEKLQ